VYDSQCVGLLRARRGQHVAAVATTRKLAVLIWHLLSKGESYVWARPALHARKLRDTAGLAVEASDRRRDRFLPCCALARADSRAKGRE
jgi:hypothetical protein